MTVVDDVFAKLAEIEIEIDKIIDLCKSASQGYWTDGDADYSDLKAIALPISDAIAVLIVDLNALTSP